MTRWFVEVFEIPGGRLLYRMGRFATWNQANDAYHRVLSATRDARIVSEEVK